jgi:hypothetical protein
MERFRADFEPRGAFGYNFYRPFCWLGLGYPFGEPLVNPPCTRDSSPSILGQRHEGLHDRIEAWAVANIGRLKPHSPFVPG